MEKNKGIIKKIEKCFNLYNNHLINKEFLIIYKSENQYRNLKLQFKKENFLHLTGIGKIKPVKFYEKLRDKTLKIKDIEIGQYSNIKLSVFPEMINIFKEKSKIGTYNQENKYHKSLSLDKGIALTVPETDAVLGIRIVENGQTVPVSLLKQKLENISYRDTITDIVCMLEKDIQEEKYSKIVYTTTNVKNLIENNKEMENLLSANLLEKE